MVTDTAGIVAGMGPAPEAPEMCAVLCHFPFLFVIIVLFTANPNAGKHSANGPQHSTCAFRLLSSHVPCE